MSAGSGDVDPELLHGWLTARSIARCVPMPVPDHGGLRVDTGSPIEVCRYVFARATPGLSVLGMMIDQPRMFLKLCDDGATLKALLPDRWHIADESHVMTGPPPRAAPLPAGYLVEREIGAASLHVRILTQSGTLAASGHAAAAFGVFAYDRIGTDPAHRRRGLGRVVMGTLAEAAGPETTHMLVATDMGRSLYETLGWRTVSSYATAVISGV